MPSPKTDYGFYSIADLQRAYRTGECTPADVVDELILRAKSTEEMNIFITLDEDCAREQAELATRSIQQHGMNRNQPLQGIPITVKDLLRTKGLRTTRGSLVTRDFVPHADSPSVERLRQAGAIIIGKTNTSEGGWKGDSANRLLGPSLNPWNPDRSAGGSSGGAGVAAAMGFGPVAVGTDGGGSVRIPASFCGVVGFKPSLGRIPYWPHSSDNLAHVGVLTRSVRDAALSVASMSGPDDRDLLSLSMRPTDLLTRELSESRTLRLGFTTSLGYAQCEPTVEKSICEAVNRLRELGYSVTELDLQLPDPFWIFDTLWAGHEAANYWDDLDEKASLLDPGYEQLIRRGRELSAGELARAHDLRHNYSQALRTATKDVDIIVTPTVPITAFPADQGEHVVVGGKQPPGLAWTPFTYPFNLTGQPAISMPTETSDDGLPIGIQFVGKFGDDRDVLDIAADYEANRQWQPAYSTLTSH